MSAHSLRWRAAYQRVADVLQQRAEQLTPDPHGYHRQYVKPDGYCPICVIVDTAPPLSGSQLARLAVLLRPQPNAVINDPVALTKAAKIMRSALSRRATHV